jgi:hypothetical protein
VRAGLELWARWAGLELVVLDDGNEPAGSVRATRQPIGRGCRIVLGAVWKRLRARGRPGAFGRGCLEPRRGRG